MNMTKRRQWSSGSGCNIRKSRIIGIPNGSWIAGTGNKKFALIAKYKKEGMTNGVSDLFICHSDGQNHGLWIEMKDKMKTMSSVSKEQRQWIDDMNKAGYVAKWAAGADAAIKIIQDYMNGYYRSF